MSNPVNLDPIGINFTLKDHTYDVLRQAILDVNIYEDDVDLRLDERKLAEQLAISRTPIREALARLAQDGLVEIIPRKGVFIQRKSLRSATNGISRCFVQLLNELIIAIIFYSRKDSHKHCCLLNI